MNAAAGGPAGRERKEDEEDERMCWRMFDVEVPHALDPGKDDLSVHAALQAAVSARLGCQVAASGITPPAVLHIPWPSCSPPFCPKCRNGP